MKKTLINIGWKEWVALPALSIPAIRAKIDTGAKTSALHAFDIKTCTRRGVDCVQFLVHPLQGDLHTEVECCAPVIDIRNVMSSNGHFEERFVIASQVEMAGRKWPIELTLSNRDPLRFRLLLGREALRQQVIINPSKALVTRKISKSELKKLYK